MFFEQSEDYRPLFWFQGRPIYVTTALVIFHAVYFAGMALWIAFTSLDDVRFMIALIPDLVYHNLELWRFLTFFSIDLDFFTNHYPTFLLYMVVLYFAGREVEQFMGRTVFLCIYVALLFIPALFFCFLGFFIPNLAFIGFFETIFGVFIAFATLYPTVCIWCRVGINNFWLAWACLALFSLIDISQHATSTLLMLWLCSAVGFVSIRLAGGGRGLNFFFEWLENRATERLAKKHQIRVVKKQEKERSIDDILEKISKQGMTSLTSSERATLERARTELINRDKR